MKKRPADEQNSPPLPREAMEVPRIPPPSTGLLGPPEPSVVLPLPACYCPPSLRRSGLRSFFLHGEPDGDATVEALNQKSKSWSVLQRLALPCILAISMHIDRCECVSTGQPPSGPQSSEKWPIWALGSPNPNSRAFRRAPRAALLSDKGRSWPTSLRGLQAGLEGPLRASPRSHAHHLGTSRPRA